MCCSIDPNQKNVYCGHFTTERHSPSIFDHAKTQENKPWP